MERNDRGGVDRSGPASAPTLTLSTVALPGPSAVPANVAALDYISPPCSRRTTLDGEPAGAQQSLPSIHDALGENAASWSAPPGSQSLPPAFPRGPPAPVESRATWPKPAHLGPIHPRVPSSTALPSPDSCSHHPSSANGHDLPAEQNGVYPARPTLEPPKILHTSLHPLDTHYPEPGSAHARPSSSFQTSPHSNPFAPGSTTSPHPPPPYQASYTGAADLAASPTSAVVLMPDHGRLGPEAQFGEAKHSSSRSRAAQAYSESVKRQLEVFDLELALNDIAHGSGRALDFAKIWTQRHQQQQRSGNFEAGDLPLVPEIEDMLRAAKRVVEALGRIKDAAVVQECAIAEEQARAQEREHGDQDVVADAASQRDGGIFPDSESKKRRGKAAPPGRCHSCNRAETPEWRRGPDGARTLCNACGLHYAKLTRKISNSKNASLTGSSLRPKHIEAPSKM